MTTLTDRYVWAAARTLSEAQRGDFDRELRERIGDASDALVEQGLSPAEAERASLTELGDPAVLAAQYVDRPLQLIGPRYYMTWWRLLKLLLAIVLPVAAVGIAIGQAVGGTPAGGIVGVVIGMTISVGVHLVFWTTLVFAILDRMPAATGTREVDAVWNLDMLPDLPDPARTSRVSDLVASLVFLVLSAAVIVAQHFVGIPWLPEFAGLPILNPELWSFWLPYFLVLIALEAAFAVAVFARGWTWPLAAVNAVLGIAFTVPALWLFLDGTLMNPAALDAMGWPWGSAGQIITVIVVVVTIGAAAWDVIDGFRKAYRAGARRVSLVE